MASRKFKIIYVAQIILALDSAGLEHKLCMRQKKDEHRDRKIRCSGIGQKIDISNKHTEKVSINFSVRRNYKLGRPLCLA